MERITTAAVAINYSNSCWLADFRHVRIRERQHHLLYALVATTIAVAAEDYRIMHSKEHPRGG